MKHLHRFFKPSDIEFTMYTFVFSLMTLALLFTFSPYFSNSKAATPAEIESLARQTKIVSADEVAAQLAPSVRPKMLVVYASWCSYCKRLMPGVHALWKEKKIPNDQLITVSLDEQLYPLAEYLLNNNFQKMIAVPVALRLDRQYTLSSALQPLGSTYKGSIPYIGFFGRDGKMKAEIHGAVRKRDIERALVNLQ
jgi:thiol-disulfide isomerase/thioredoxin